MARPPAGSRPLPLALATVVLLSLLAAAAPAAEAGGAVEFENARMRAKEKEILSRYAEVVARWAVVQRVVQAVVAQNAEPLSSERIQAIDRAWQAGEDPDGLATRLASNECSLVLVSLLAANPGYAEAFVTDSRGAIVCMTSRTSDYYQGDEPGFQRAWAGGAGAMYVAAEKHDESLGLTTVQISVPVRSAGQTVGVLTVGRISTSG